jgi:phasin family protein
VAQAGNGVIRISLQIVKSLFFKGNTMLTLDQVTAAQKNNLESLIGMTAQAFAGVEKIVELNIATAKAAFSDAATQAQAALNVKDAQEFLALQSAQLQPLAEKVSSYGRKAFEIASTTGAELRTAVESKVKEAQAAAQTVTATATKKR